MLSMKIINTFPNYSISENGIVVNILTGRIMKTFFDKKGYERVGLRKNKVRKNHYIHRLVAESFVTNPFNKETVNHKNGIKKDNRIENLEWLTNKENINHALDTGLKQRRKYEPSLLVKSVSKLIPIHGNNKQKRWHYHI